MKNKIYKKWNNKLNLYIQYMYNMLMHLIIIWIIVNK